MLGRITFVAIALLTACGGDDDSGGGDDDPEGFTYDAARACSDGLNERDGEAYAAGQQASLDVLLWTSEGEEPSDDERDAAADAIDAYRAELERTRDELAELDPGDDEAAAWDEYLAAFDTRLDGLARRADQARTGDGEPQPGDGDIDTEQVTAVLGELDLGGRDCETVFGDPGPDPGHRDFVVAAAEACTTIVSRRQANDFAADTDRVLMTVAQVARGERIGTGGVAEALTAIEAEWEATVEDLGRVPDDDVPDADEWATTLAAAEERIEIARARSEALESGDLDEMAAAFEPGALMEHPSFGDLQALGLDRRDCRSVAP